MSEERDRDAAEAADPKEKPQQTAEGSKNAAAGKRQYAQEEIGMNDSFNLNSPIMAEFVTAINISLEQLLNLMLQKKATSGGLGISLKMELTDEMAADEQTGEAVTIYNPEIKYSVKKKLEIETTAMKGGYTGNEIVLCCENGEWIQRKKNEQLKLF